MQRVIKMETEYSMQDESQSERSESGYEYDIEFEDEQSDLDDSLLEDDPLEDKLIEDNKKLPFDELPIIIPEGKMEEQIQPEPYDDIMATLLQIEEDEKLAMELFKKEKQIVMNKIEQTTYIGNTKLSETHVRNPLKPVKAPRVYCLGRTANGTPCGHVMKKHNTSLFCCNAHRMQYLLLMDSEVKRLVLRILCSNIPDRNIRKKIYSLLYL